MEVDSSQIEWTAGRIAYAGQRERPEAIAAPLAAGA